MEKWSKQIRILRSPRYLPLRYRFIALSSCLLILLLGAIAFLLGMQQSRSIRDQLERRGLAMAQSLAATCKADFATYNYIALQRVANQAAQDPDTVYVILHDKEGRVAGYSGRPDLERTYLNDAVSSRAVSTTQPLIQRTMWGSETIPVLDITVPVFLPGSDRPWGAIRVALSLQPMYQQIRQIHLIIAGVGFVAILFGILIAIWAARRVTLPLGRLVEASVEAARGNLDQSIQVETGDEVEVLARNFSIMIREVLSQRRQLEQQLNEIRRLQRYTEKLLTTMSDGLLSVDRSGNVATINPAARRLLGVSDGELPGAPAASLLTAVPDLLCHMEEMIQHPRSSTQLEMHLNRDDEPRIILVGSSVLLDAAGNPSEVITSLHDVTELKKLEARVRQTERLAALGTLAAGMAHEVRNPLSAIKTFVQLLPRKVEKPGFLEKFQRTVPRELERINRLIEDLLDLARDPRYHFREVSLRLLLDQSAELFEEDLQINGIRYHAAVAAQLPQIWADTDQIAKAFHNLFRNALQAMPTGGELLVEARFVTDTKPADTTPSSRKGWAAVTFKDTGTGISPDHLKNIFNPFFTTKDKGTGLGLAITYKVITEHGGHIEVSSIVGKGTSFTVYLPASTNPSRIPSA